jgi:protein SCO1/2
VLRAWLNHFDASFIGLDGTVAEVQAAQRAAGVPVAVKTSGGPNYSMGHAAWVLAYADDDRGYVEFPFGTRQSAYVHDLTVLDAIPATSGRTAGVRRPAGT